MKRILIVLLNVILIFTFIGFNYTISFASEGSITAPSPLTVGETFTITVNIPSDAVAYQGEISVKCSDGSVQSSGVLAKVTGIDGDYAHPGNMTFKATAKSEGTATITVSNLNITNKSGAKVNSNSTLTANVTVNKKQETAPATTTQTTTPATTTTPTTTTTTSSDPTFTNVSETVTATETVNVRSKWDASSSALGQVEKGKTVLRTGKGSNGWDRVTYNGKIGYIMSKWLTASTTTTTTTTTSSDPTFTNVSETVTANETVNVRSKWDATSTKLGQIEKGKTVTRTGKGSNGWDRITYNGNTGYVMSKYLTAQNTDGKTETTDSTPEEPTWRETGDTVYATINMNVRSGWDKSFSSVGGLKKGDSTTRIAVGSNGWDKIKYEGKTAYVLSRLLTTEVVEPDEVEDDEEENKVDENEVTNTSDATANMAAEEKDVYNQLIEEVGVLPAVGRNYADVVYVIALSIVLAMVGFVGLKIRENEE